MHFEQKVITELSQLAVSVGWLPSAVSEKHSGWKFQNLSSVADRVK